MSAKAIDAPMLALIIEFYSEGLSIARLQDRLRDETSNPPPSSSTIRKYLGEAGVLRTSEENLRLLYLREGAWRVQKWNLREVVDCALDMFRCGWRDTSEIANALGMPEELAIRMLDEARMDEKEVA